MNKTVTSKKTKKISKTTCVHSKLIQERILGAGTGDYRCISCGEIGWGSDWPEKIKKAKKS